MRTMHALSLLTACGLATTASAQTAIAFGLNDGFTGTVIPGTGGLTVDGGLSSTFVASSDGTQWLWGAFVNSGDSSTNEVLVQGSGLSFAGAQLVMREETTDLFGTGRLVDGIDNFNSINNAGDIAVSGDFDGSTSDDDFIVSRIGGVWTLVAQEGGDASALFGAGALFDFLNTARIDINGNVGFLATSIDNVDTGLDEAIVYPSSTVFLREGDSVGGEGWENFDSDDFDISADGSSYLVQGDLAGDTGIDDVVVVNGNIVIREGFSTAGATVEIIFDSLMTASGSWFVNFDDPSDENWVIRNGALIASTDASSAASDIGSTGLKWDDTEFSLGFFLFAENNSGDYIIGGLTDSGDTTSDAMIVFNGTTIVLREGDAVDLDGNGLFDDGVFINTFGDDDWILRDDGVLMGTVSLRDASGNRVGEALIYAAIPAPGTAALLGLAGLAAVRRRRG